MSKKWIISDLHLGHKNILKYSGGLRGGTTSEEHDEWIIHQINSTVKKGDLLYILGDVAMNTDHLKKVGRIKGQKLMCRGNHDINNIKFYKEYFNDVFGLLSYRGVFWLSHAPVHPQELRGRFNIHGHVHQNSVKVENTGELDRRYINACVEMSYGIPQSLDDLFEQYKQEVYQNRAKIIAERENNEEGEDFAG